MFIGDIPQRIIAKVILYNYVIGNDIQLAAGALQTCVSHDAGSEATIYTMRALFDDNNTHVTFLKSLLMQQN